MIDSSSLFKGIITHTGLWGAIISTIVITLLGFLLYKFKVLNDNSTISIQKIIINILLPFLAFYSFLKNADKTDLKTFAIVFGLSIIYYVSLTTIAIFWVKFLPKMIPKNVIHKAEIEHDRWIQTLNINERTVFNSSTYLEKIQRKHLVTWLMCIYGSNILFATPIIMSVYPNGIELGALNVWNILYYVGGFGLAFSLLSGVKFTKKEFKFTMKKAFLNPAFIAMIIAFLLWSSQYIPGAGVTYKDINFKGWTKFGNNAYEQLNFIKQAIFGPSFSSLFGIKEHGIMRWFIYNEIEHIYVPYNGNPTGWFDLNVTMPYIAKPINILVSLISPLIWIIIGTSLAKTNLKEMFLTKANYLFLLYKVVLIPLFILCLMIPLVITKQLKPSVGAILVMTGAVPPGATITIYSQHFKVHEKYTAQVSSLSTLLSFIFIPIWLVLGIVILNLL
ncbi:AEC family transporter [Metamycoplasma buccale]|uniref:AEC family transporter n=1 Tax=Metamycoplasma buccale TaxID=55602 RepID=UPI00398EB7CB